MELINKLNKQLNATSFTKIILSILIIFIIFHAAIWNIYTKSIFNLPDGKIIGDMTRMSYDKDISVVKDKERIDFFSMQTWDGKAVDLLTIGDSFSNGGGGYCYQNYLVNTNNLRVLNVSKVKILNADVGYIESIIVLSNSGLLKKINPKSILIESVQRKALRRFAKDIDFTLSLNLKNNKNDTSKSIFKKITSAPAKIPKATFINNINYNALIYNVLYNFDDRAYFSKIYKLPLTKELFTNKKPQLLLCYKNDIENIPKETETKIKWMNNNFNILSDKLKKQNIDLYVMPVVDKYTLYLPYIKNNKYPKSIFFDKLTKLEKRYYFINTKEILRTEIKKGKKDLYWADDTHWSTNAIKAVFSKVYFPKHSEK